MNPKKLRTSEQLSDFLQSELSWRKKELNVLSVLLSSKGHKSSSYIDSLLRASITVLYAHWEGYVKIAATAYICFVAMQKLKHKNLASNFLAMSVKGKLHPSSDLPSNILYKQITEFFLSEMDNSSHIVWDKMIDTEANLSSKIFRNIIELLGLEYLSAYETRQNIIDAQLLKNRNDAAHGDGLIEIDETKLFELFDTFIGEKDNLGLLDLFTNQIVNAALQKKYLEVPLPSS